VISADLVATGTVPQTAKALGMDFPALLLAKADELIE
jgi:hypothetical protein